MNKLPISWHLAFFATSSRLYVNLKRTFVSSIKFGSKSLMLPCLCSLLSVLCSPLLGQQTHPKIGLALSGGGAKGIAHIGVLEVLEEAGIRPDYVTGTSIGSIVGGLYAIGYSVEDLKRLALELDWIYYFNDELKRTDMPIEERFNSDRYQLKLGIENNAIQLPKGFIQGQKIGLLLSNLTIPVHGIYDFSDFDIPFRCVATDAETGGAIVLKSGSLAKAMRASMSLPSVFEPMELDGKLLIDGGVVQNLPVIEVIEMGADIVIAVDITSPLYKKEDLSSLVQVLVQTSTYKLSEAVAVQKELADIVISPNIRDIGTLDFSKGDTLLQLGRIAARSALPQIYQKIQNRTDSLSRDITIPDAHKIHKVTLKGDEVKNHSTVANLMQINANREYSIDIIEQRIKQLFGSQFFRDAYYELIPVEEGHELHIDAALKSGEYLQLSANYDSDLKAALLMNATFRNRGLNGSKFSLDFKLSENPLLLANYQVYTTSKPNIGIHLSGKLNHYPLNFYDMEGAEDEVTGLYHYNLALNLFSSFNNSSLLNYGIGLERFSQRSSFFDSDTEDIGAGQTVAFLGYLRDTYDRQHYPREGAYLSLSGQLALSNSLDYSVIGRDNPVASYSHSARLQFSKIFPLSETVAIQWYNDAGFVEFNEDNLPNNFLNLFYLGRSIPEEPNFIEFYGLDYMELPVSSYWFTGMRIRNEFKSNIYGSLLLNVGQYKANAYQRIIDDEVDIIPTETDGIFGMGAEIGFVSPLGPGRFSAEYNLGEGRINFALHLGYVF